MNTEIDAEYRIHADIEVYEGHLPERFAIAWKAYLTGLMEWELLDLSEYNRLLDLLPEITNDPVIDILTSKKNLLAGESLDIIAELQVRIQMHINEFGGTLPEAYAIAWNSYLASLREWQVIAPRPYKQLLNLLPPILNPDPVLTIFSGRQGAYAFQEYIKEDMEEFQGDLPERNTIAWKAYLRGLWEYGAISTKVYQQLLGLLPTTINLEELNIFSERGQSPKGPGGIGGVIAQVSAELHSRLLQQINAFQGNLPEYYLIAWKAYLLSMEKWDILDWSDYTQLITLLPPIPSPDPVQRIVSKIT